MSTSSNEAVVSKGFRALTRLERRRAGTLLGWPGGQYAGADLRAALAAQTIIAAGRTVDTRWRWVHSAHIAYLSEADPGSDAEYDVELLRDTDHFSTRLTRVRQGERTLAVATLSFQVPRRGTGPDYQGGDHVHWPDPHSLPASCADRSGMVEVRRLPTPEADRMWMRLTEELPDKILLHSAAIVLAADLLLAETAARLADGATARANGRALRPVPLGSSVLVHRCFRADDWLRHDHAATAVTDHRTFVAGRFRSSMGRLVVSASQEVALLPQDRDR